MKKIIATAALAAVSCSAFAMPTPGDSSLNTYGPNGAASFVFDTNSATLDVIDQTGLGISFTAGPLGLTVTSVGTPIGKVIQDRPGNGGLGVDGIIHDDGPFSDNMGGGEALRFDFDRAVALSSIDLNGLVGSNGHTNRADGRLNFVTSAGTITVSAADFDGRGTDAALPSIFDSSITWFEVETLSDSWHGYVDSLTARVPAPGIAALLGFGLVGIAAVRRRA